MRPFTHIITSGARHLLVMMAIAAVLMTTIGFHVHSEADVHEHAKGSEKSCSHAGHVATKFSMAAVDLPDAVNDEQPSGVLDPDGCGHCHCQIPSADLPAIADLDMSTALVSVLKEANEPAVLVGICLQPEPPPIRS